MVLGKVFTGLQYRLRKLARSFGYQIVIDQSPHSIHTTYEKPNKSKRAWDENLFKHGQLYVRGYANPVKLIVDHDTEMEESDTVTLYESNHPRVVTDGGDDGEPVVNAHAKVISSPRYREYMQNDLVSQLLNPRAQWKLILYALIGLGAIMLVNTVIVIMRSGVLGA